MPKFNVTLGRLIREQASVVVEAKSKEDLESRLHEVYEVYDGDWFPDNEWGCNESDCHTVDGPAAKNKKVDVKLSGGK